LLYSLHCRVYSTADHANAISLPKQKCNLDNTTTFPRPVYYGNFLCLHRRSKPCSVARKLSARCPRVSQAQRRNDCMGQCDSPRSRQTADPRRCACHRGWQNQGDWVETIDTHSERCHSDRCERQVDHARFGLHTQPYWWNGSCRLE
jgi:hypothetical protein